MADHFGDMVAHTKTTIELSDEVLSRAKRQARREGKTLREVVEQALRQQLAGPDPAPFRLRRHPFKGQGRQDFSRFSTLKTKNPLLG
jgi:hypothetical protein